MLSGEVGSFEPFAVLRFCLVSGGLGQLPNRRCKQKVVVFLCGVGRLLNFSLNTLKGPANRGSPCSPVDVDIGRDASTARLFGASELVLLVKVESPRSGPTVGAHQASISCSAIRRASASTSFSASA